MQDIHHIGGGSGGGGTGAGRFFGGGDRRLRPHNHLNHQALKCPRCDSLNTKFCYYNNYNLSQPRHFCKSCRRYWTKGGVLRNVPVGGGCRKTKRSRQKIAKDRSSNAYSSSSESSSLTAATAAAATTATTPTSTATAEEGSAPTNTAPIINFSDARFVTTNPSFDATPPPIVNRSIDAQIFSTDTFTSLMPSPPPTIAAFGVGDVSIQFQRGNQTTTVPDNPAPSDFGDEGLAAALDWGNGGGGGTNGGDQGLFDLTAAVDPAYWSQPQWTDSDNSALNYLP